MKSIKNFALAVCLALLAITSAHAFPADGILVGATKITLQGGNNSSVQWSAPTHAKYKVWVKIPENSTATNAVYQLYLKGSATGSVTCSSSDAIYPCYAVTVNQAANQGKWVQLILGATRHWQFNSKGYVSINASNVSSTEQLGVAAVSFENIIPSLAIGQIYKGGIIFYLDASKLHGLVAARTDITAMKWYNDTYTTTGATGTAVGTGKANTAAIIANQGEGTYAAKLCDDLVIGVYNDWYLPSKDELSLMYANIGRGAAAPLFNVGGFVADYYWSSSETNFYNAWDTYFGKGVGQTNYAKYNGLYVRAVRSF